MADILITVPVGGCRQWQKELSKRLTECGHAIEVQSAGGSVSDKGLVDRLLSVEHWRFGSSLAGFCEIEPSAALSKVDLVIDLAGGGAKHRAPILTVGFNGRDSFSAGLEQVVAGRSADVAVRLDGDLVARGRPMIRDRLWLSRAADDLLAGAISLVVQAVQRFAAGRTETPTGIAPSKADRAPFALHYPVFVAKGVAERIRQKRKLGKRPFYWQVAYRLIEGTGIAESGRLDGAPFTVLPDDGSRLYADPFVFETGGRTHLFVEEFPYATGRGVIAAAELREDGTFESPKVVLEEPHHLSYPQVFAHEGEIYMIPESAAAREVVLYRAAPFPDRWVRDTVLLADRDVNDATLLERDGRFWLFGTERFGYGSPSDIMVAYVAERLRGPWTASPLNPIAVDHSTARPGGQFIRDGREVLLPVQNGAESYGGGLGLMRLEKLDLAEIRFSPPRPILPGPAWDRKGIHTLNRSGKVEVIDSAG